MKTYHFIIAIVGLMCVLSCKHEYDCNGCLNGGKCVNNACQCPPGYFGERCEKKDSCFGLNCQNGGKCNIDSCKCLPTYFGKNCEKSLLDGKKYYVTNLKFNPDWTSNAKYDFDDYVKPGEIFTAKSAIDASEPWDKVVVTFTGSNQFYKYKFSEFKNVLFGSVNSINSRGYTQDYIGKVSNNGDTIHFTVVHFDQYQFGYYNVEIACYDFVKL